jgi:hypothetical protein
MSEFKDGGPAFPTPYTTGQSGEYYTEFANGMTLRDYFAARAMQGFVTRQIIERFKNSSKWNN